MHHKILFGVIGLIRCCGAFDLEGEVFLRFKLGGVNGLGIYNVKNSRTAHRTAETSSYTYFHVLRRPPSTCKLFKVLVSWPLTR
jgi:hypothetical protein